MATAKTSLAHIKTDPLRNFKFEVHIRHPKAGLGRMGFMSVSGLNISTEVIPYREGGMNTTTQKLPGQSDFAPLTLSKGLAVGDASFMTWMLELFSVIQGDGTGTAGDDFRSRVDIKVLAHPVTRGPVPTKAHFRVHQAWPTSVAFSDLDAGANAIVIQQMTLAHEGFEFAVATKAGPHSEPPSFRNVRG